MNRWIPKEYVEYAVIDQLSDDLDYEQAEEACGIANGAFEMLKRPEHWPESAVEAQKGVLTDKYGLDWDDIEREMSSLYHRRTDERYVATLRDYR